MIVGMTAGREGMVGKETTARSNVELGQGENETRVAL
jgi:hypothetical protein